MRTSNIKYSLLDYIIIIVYIITIASASSLCYNTIFKQTILIILLILALIKKKKIHPILFVVIFFNIFIEACASYYLGNTSFNIFRIYNYIYPIVFSYAILHISGEKFIIKLEKIIFILTCISLPIFCIQVVNLPFIESLSSSFNSFLAEPLQKGASWYIFIFNYCWLPNSPTITRNSGFMWEPGAFALVLVIFLIYRIIKNNYSLKNDTHAYIYFIAIITTFSTSGYIALILILIPSILRTQNKIFKIILLILFAACVPIIFQLDFISGKIDSYLEDTNAFSYGYHSETGTIEFNRYMFFEYVLNEIAKFPLGYGSNPVLFSHYEVVAPNGLAQLLYHWGIIGFIFIIVSLYKSIKCFSNNQKSRYTLLYLLAISVLLFSNPVHFNPILFTLILIPFLFKKIYTI